MKTFDEALNKAIDNNQYISGLDGGDYDEGYDEGFIDGLEGALYLIYKHKNEAINEILTKYMSWVDNTSGKKFADWLHEEGDYEKAKARVRKEFIEFLNNK